MQIAPPDFDRMFGALADHTRRDIAGPKAAASIAIVIVIGPRMVLRIGAGFLHRGLRYDGRRDESEQRCRRAENFTRYDHTVLVGDIAAGHVASGEPLLYAKRRMDWALQGGDGVQ